MDKGSSSGVSWFQNHVCFQVQVSTCPITAMWCTNKDKFDDADTIPATWLDADSCWHRDTAFKLTSNHVLHPRQLKKRWQLQSQSVPLVQSAQQQKPQQKKKFPLVRGQRRRQQQTKQHCQLQAKHLSTHHLQRNQPRRTKWTPQVLHAGWTSSPLTQTRASKFAHFRRRLCFLWFPKLQC